MKVCGLLVSVLYKLLHKCRNTSTICDAENRLRAPFKILKAGMAVRPSFLDAVGLIEHGEKKREILYTLCDEKFQ